MTTVTLINCFQVPAEREAEFLALWHQADALLRTRGGYLTTRLHKALQPDSRYQYINIAELDSVQTWKAAITSPEFTAITAQMAEFHPAPGLYSVTVSHRRQTSSRPG
jgi:antibiotic biosynthesis monooxygenase (ABM) superfamily enzyme